MKAGTVAIDSNTIFSIRTRDEFNAFALEIFHFQATNNSVYESYIKHIGVQHSKVSDVSEIPFLPVSFFKTHKVVTEEAPYFTIFSSSGTTGTSTSKHHIVDLNLYEKSFQLAFENAYGPIENYAVLALLPSYLERQGSSLVYMVDHMIKASNHSLSGFYLDELNELAANIKRLEAQNQRTLLIGVTYALLDLIERHSFNLQHTKVMETGGMKGRRKEMIRHELHERLTDGFGVDQIHSEYGMTELLSQAYSKGNGLFTCPPWMGISIREANDPFAILPNGRTGGVNIIDLANLYSCSFIATQDLGKKYDDGTFEILGRFDNSDLRGCNLMVG